MSAGFPRCGSIILEAWLQCHAVSRIHHSVAIDVKHLEAESVTRKSRERDGEEAAAVTFRPTDRVLLSSSNQFLRQEFLVCSFCQLLSGHARSLASHAILDGLRSAVTIPLI